MKTTGQIRTIAGSDARAYQTFIESLDTETKFMLFEPGERNDSKELYQTSIDASVKDANVAWFVAESEGKIIGFVRASRGTQNRVRHRTYLAMGVLAAYHRQGIARRLLQSLFEWADERQIERIELTVVVNNTAAIAPYTKLGFTIEGPRTYSLKIDGEWVDEYAMARIASKQR